MPNDSAQFFDNENGNEFGVASSKNESHHYYEQFDFIGGSVA